MNLGADAPGQAQAEGAPDLQPGGVLAGLLARALARAEATAELNGNVRRSILAQARDLPARCVRARLLGAVAELQGEGVRRGRGPQDLEFVDSGRHPDIEEAVIQSGEGARGLIVHPDLARGPARRGAGNGPGPRGRAVDLGLEGERPFPEPQPPPRGGGAVE